MKTNKQKVLCGIDVIANIGIELKGKCGLITNHTGVLKDLSSTVDLLREKCELTALFSPEHGVRGDIQAGQNVGSFVDRRTMLPVYSLFGDDIAESETMLSSMDTVIFDIQDVGARFYTYLYTMTDAMHLCAEHGIKFIVLDRPNPLGGLTVDGTVLDERFSSFVGRFPTPTRCGLTIGEFALMMNETQKIGCDLDVVSMQGWKREYYYDETDLVFIQPSPNIPTVDSAFCYIGTCIFEETNISEGRGTAKPFELLGAPWLDSKTVIEKVGVQKGVILRECYFTPTFSDYRDTFCQGIQLHITDRDSFSSFEVGIRIFDAIRKTHNEFCVESDIAKLLGTQDIFDDNFDVDSLIIKHRKKVSEWQINSKKWYLY